MLGVGLFKQAASMPRICRQQQQQFSQSAFLFTQSVSLAAKRQPDPPKHFYPNRSYQKSVISPL